MAADVDRAPCSGAAAVAVATVSRRVFCSPGGRVDQLQRADAVARWDCRAAVHSCALPAFFWHAALLAGAAYHLADQPLHDAGGDAARLSYGVGDDTQRARYPAGADNDRH